MILSVQRVRAANGEWGVNCVQFNQDPQIAVVNPFERLAHPAHLVWQHRPLPFPGNRIVTFIDVFGPEDATAEEIFAGIGELLQLQLPACPRAYCGPNSRIAFSIVMAPVLANNWRQEVVDLLQTFFQVHP